MPDSRLLAWALIYIAIYRPVTTGSVRPADAPGPPGPPASMVALTGRSLSGLHGVALSRTAPGLADAVIHQVGRRQKWDSFIYIYIYFM